MVWFKVDDHFHSHRKVAEVGLAAIGLWVKAGSWCGEHETDGVITVAVARSLGGTRKMTSSLVKSGLWEQRGDVFAFHDWADMNPTHAEKEEEREDTRERVADFRSKRHGKKRGGNTVTHSLVTSTPNPNPNPNLFPSPTETGAPPSAGTSSGRKDPADYKPGKVIQDAFIATYTTIVGSPPKWGKVEGCAAARLGKNPGLDPTLRGIENMRHDPPSFPPSPCAFLAFADRVDAFVIGGSGERRGTTAQPTRADANKAEFQKMLDGYVAGNGAKLLEADR